MNKIILKESDIIVLPTDTVYGIGCKMRATDTLTRLFEIKKRPFEKAIPVLVSSVEQASEFAWFSEAELRLANRFWPGALTLILKTKKEFEILDEENLHKASYIVTIGGDGTLLRAFRNIKNKKRLTNT